MCFPGPLNFRLLRKFISVGAVRKMAMVFKRPEGDFGLNSFEDALEFFAVGCSVIESGLLAAAFAFISEIKKEFACFWSLDNPTHGTHLLRPLARHKRGCRND